ncbi:MAG TPA: hypothetical protein VK961_23150 [Chthoniobacter sp.]|nr:hypothetical protein [Chthoniobacter sp.]
MPSSIVIQEDVPRRRAVFVDVQKGYPLIYLLTATSFVTLVSTWFVSPPYVATLLLLPQLAALVCFCTLFIQVKEGCITWQFGPGWIRGRVLLSEVVTTRIILSPFAYGWGFRRIGSHWRFHRDGALALEIIYRGRRRLRLGTTRAHALQHCIECARGLRHRDS